MSYRLALAGLYVLLVVTVTSAIVCRLWARPLTRWLLRSFSIGPPRTGRDPFRSSGSPETMSISDSSLTGGRHGRPAWMLSWQSMHTMSVLRRMAIIRFFQSGSSRRPFG